MENYYLGLMSGTSLDGVDIALVNFDKTAKNHTALLYSDFTPMPENLRLKLKNLIFEGQTSLQNLGEIDHELGKLYAQVINDFLKKYQLLPTQIKAAGIHGQTIWHAPLGDNPFTMQIGDMNMVAEKTQITVVGDFRRRDIAVGGQGAPLVPAFHEGIFKQEDCLTVVLNMGGISNISVLSPEQPTIGYDVTVGNALLDSWVEQHLGLSFDKNASWAKTGKIHTALLESLMTEPFLQLPPPKSTGRELFNLSWLEQHLNKFNAIAPEDVQRTLTEFTALSIAYELQKYQSAVLKNRVLCCGGGARNPLIMERLQYHLAQWQVATTTEFGLDIDYVEAAAFAWLAKQRMENQPSNLPAVTGAKKSVSLGVIYRQ